MNDFFPIYDIISDDHGGMIVGKNGTLSYMIKLKCPEVYSLYSSEIEQRHSTFIQAFSHMPDNSYVHKQDLYTVREYEDSRPQLSYLAESDREHFTGRRYLDHSCIIAFTLAGLSSFSPAYVSNAFSFKSSYAREDMERIESFLSGIEFAINNISPIKGSAVSFLSEEEIREYVMLSANFLEEKGLKDIRFADRIEAGSIRARMYALTDAEFFPDSMEVSIKDYTVSKDKSELYISPAESFGGIHLFHNHVYNQILYFFSDRRLKERLRKTLDEYIANRGWDRVNFPAKIEALTQLVREISSSNELLCYSHYSVLLWDESEEELAQAEKDLRSAMDMLDLNYYIPSYGNLMDLFRSSIIGNVGSMPNEYLMESTLSMAVSMFTHYSPFSNDSEGIFFNDRLHQIPLRKDIWDAAKKRIKARNSVVVAPTGSGKSFFVNNILHQLLDEDYTIVAVEFGNSFKQLSYLYPDKSIHIEYDPSMPLGINPFEIDGRGYTPEREENLVSMCLRFWKRPADDSNMLVALKKFLSLYYRTDREQRSFQDFYRFLTSSYRQVCRETDVREDYFDIDSFRHVCSEMMPGGAYANLVATDGVASGLADRKFIHFELTKVKASPFVASIVMAMLFDVINSKILSDPSKRGYIVFDEYAETAQMKSATSMDVDIHQAVAFFYQKIRKENGAVMTIIQSPVQLPDNEYTRGIIANTQLLYVLEGTEVVYDSIIDTFRIKNQAQINQMKSIQNNYASSTPYSECWIRFGENYALTVRLEASPRKFLAFQTEGEKRAALDRLYAENGHDMQAAIETYYNNSKNRKP